MTIMTVIIIMVIMVEKEGWIMPRALTEQEKCRICNRLLEKGKEITLLQGIRKVSVDDITKAAGMAKGSFYQHFESKERFLVELIVDIHRQIFVRAEQILLGGDDLRSSVRVYLMTLFHTPEMTFLVKNYREINELVDAMSDQEIALTNQIEVDMYDRLLVMVGIDTTKAKPGVVHNYMHTLHMIMGSDMMIADDLPETFELILDSLISYIFGGTQ